jgi:hypothetical protein
MSQNCCRTRLRKIGNQMLVTTIPWNEISIQGQFVIDHLFIAGGGKSAN